MPVERIPSNSTVRTIVDLLADKEDYIRGVIGHLIARYNTDKSAMVRIGVMGTGSYPNYRIESVGHVHECYDGRNHERIFERDALQDENWSTATMVLEDLRTLFAEVAPHRVIIKTAS